VLTSNALSKVISAGSAGKPTHHAVLALKSRVALYAGSIARYGLQSKKLYNEGIVGIPESAANELLKAIEFSKNLSEIKSVFVFGLYLLSIVYSVISFKKSLWSLNKSYSLLISFVIFSGFGAIK
jgi:hypothetical protein